MGTRRLAGAKLKITFAASNENVLTDEQVARCSHGSTSIGPGNIDSGVIAGAANRVWEDLDHDLASAGTQVVDLYDFAGIDIGAGSGLDSLGQALALENIVAIIIKHNSGAGSLEIAPDASAGWSPIGSHTVATGGALKAGGLLAKYQNAEGGFALTDASSHRIILTATGGAVNYSMWVLGRDDDEESSSSSNSSSSSSVSSSSSSSISSSSSSSSSSLSSSSTSSLSSSSSSSVNSSSSSSSSVNSSSSSPSSLSSSSSSS